MAYEISTRLRGGYRQRHGRSRPQGLVALSFRVVLFKSEPVQPTTTELNGAAPMTYVLRPIATQLAQSRGPRRRGPQASFNNAPTKKKRLAPPKRCCRRHRLAQLVSTCAPGGASTVPLRRGSLSF